MKKRAVVEEIDWANKTHDQVRAFLVDWARRFQGGTRDPKPHIRDGIEFWVVGRNASHEFYAGVKDGKCFRYSAGEGMPKERVSADRDELDFDAADLLPTYEESEITEVPDFNGYYGHF